MSAKLSKISVFCFFLRVQPLTEKKCSFDYKKPQMAFEYEQSMRASVFTVTETLNIKLPSVWAK